MGTVFFVDFYEGYGCKPTRPAVDFDYFYSIVDKLLVGSPEEKSSTRLYRIKVSLSNERFKVWDDLNIAMMIAGSRYHMNLPKDIIVRK